MHAVALCAPYDGMARTARKICEVFDRPILIEMGDLQEGLKKARALVEQGTKVIISRGGTAGLLRETLEIPIVEIQVTAYDILLALQKVRHRNSRIGIIGFGNVVFGSQKIGEILGLDLITLAIRSEEDVRGTLRTAAEKGVNIVIGDKVVVSHACEMGYESILIESGEESILESFREAYRILEAVQLEARKSRQYLGTLNQLKAVLDSVDDQIVLLDAEDRIQACNPAALRVFRKDERQVKEQPLHLYPLEPLKEIKKRLIPRRNHLAHVRGKPVLLDYIPIEAKGERMGTLIVGKNISKLQQAERKVRSELYLKGHLARYTFSDIVSEDESILRVMKRAERFSSSSSTVLILGETGTGKEMIAQSIHNARFGPDRPFVAINCATLPESLLESELFGYAPGAFTGARNEGKKGLFELAHGGTLLLDEIGELPLNLQSRLLRVIEERQIQPIGDGRVIPVDVRIIATTNRDIAEEVNEKRYRADLFYRLNVLQFRVPPLRQRGRDVIVLFNHFVLRMNPKCDIAGIVTKEVETLLCEYKWPGNIRELKNLVERLSAMTCGFTQAVEEVREWIREELPVGSGAAEAPIGDPDEENLTLRELELSWIRKLSESSQMNKSELARFLGISRTTLWKKTRTH